MVVVLLCINGDEMGEVLFAKSTFAVLAKIDGFLHPLRDSTSRGWRVSPALPKFSEFLIEFQQKTTIAKQQVNHLISHSLPKLLECFLLGEHPRIKVIPIILYLYLRGILPPFLKSYKRYSVTFEAEVFGLDLHEVGILSKSSAFVQSNVPEAEVPQ